MRPALLVAVAVLVTTACAGAEEPPKRSLPPDVRAGAKLFAEAGCMQCHVYAGMGAASLGAPDLTRQAERKRGIGWEVRYLRCPRCLNSGSLMPSYAGLGARNLRRLAAFLEASDGTLADRLDWGPAS